MSKLVSLASWSFLSVAMIGCVGADRADPSAANADHPQASTSTSAPTSPSESRAPDATSTPGPLKPLSVVVTTGSKANNIVLFHDADGNVIGRTPTDATGTAVAPDDLEPSQVTILFGTDGSTQTRNVTWTGVARGDVLVVQNRALMDQQNTYAVTMPGAYPGANGYLVDEGCYGGPPVPLADAATQPMTASMCSDARTAVIASAEGPNGTLAYAFAKNVPAPTGSETPITLTQWVAATPRTVTVTNQDSGHYVNLGLFQQIGTEFYGSSDLVEQPTGSTTFMIAPGFAEHYVAWATLWIQNAPGVSAGAPLPSFDILQLADAASTTVDLSNTLPPLTSASVDQSDPGRPLVRWTGGDDPTIDGGVVSLSWSFGTVGGDQPSWDIYVPPGSTQVKAPALPDDLASARPAPVGPFEPFGMGAFVRVDDTDSAETYGDYRQAIAGAARPLPKATIVRTTTLLAGSP